MSILHTQMQNLHREECLFYAFPPERLPTLKQPCVFESWRFQQKPFFWLGTMFEMSSVLFCFFFFNGDISLILPYHLIFSLFENTQGTQLEVVISKFYVCESIHN